MRGGRRLTAATLYGRAALRYRSPGNAVAAVGAAFGRRGDTADRVLARVRWARTSTASAARPLRRPRGSERSRRETRRSSSGFRGPGRRGSRPFSRGGRREYLEEPDNHLRFAYAFRAKRRLGLGSYPALASDADAAALTDYEALWREAFSPTRASTADGYRRRVANRLLTAAGSRRISAALGAPSPVLR